MPSLNPTDFDAQNKKVPGYTKLMQNSGAPPWDEAGKTPDQPYAGVRGDEVPHHAA